jgi:hypothetical protein
MWWIYRLFEWWRRLVLTNIFNRSISLSTHPTDPSPEQINIRNGSKCRNNRKPNPGPDDIRSNTCAGFNSCLKRRRNLTPWLSPDFEFTKTNSGEKLPCGLTTSHASSNPMECNDTGGTTDTLVFPKLHFTLTLGRQAVCTQLRHHKHRQSCSLKTDPQILSHTKHLEYTGKFPSIHWCGICKIPSISSIISLPTLAKVVHLQLAIALAAHFLCTLHLHTSHDKPCEVTPEIFSRHTLQKQGFVCDVEYL